MFREHEGTGAGGEVSDSCISCCDKDVEVWLTDFSILFAAFSLFAIESS